MLGELVLGEWVLGEWVLGEWVPGECVLLGYERIHLKTEQWNKFRV